MTKEAVERAAPAIGDTIELKDIEHYIIGENTIPKKFVKVIDNREGIIQSDLFNYPVSLADMRVKLKGIKNTIKVSFIRIEEDTIQLTTYAAEAYSERYVLPDGRAVITGELGELTLPVRDISFGFVSIRKMGKDVVAIRPHRVELNTSIGVNVVSEIIRVMDKEDYTVFELAVDLDGWVRALRRRAEADT